MAGRSKPRKVAAPASVATDYPKTQFCVTCYWPLIWTSSPRIVKWTLSDLSETSVMFQYISSRLYHAEFFFFSDWMEKSLELTDCVKCGSTDRQSIIPLLLPSFLFNLVANQPWRPTGGADSYYVTIMFPSSSRRKGNIYRRHTENWQKIKKKKKKKGQNCDEATKAEQQHVERLIRRVFKSNDSKLTAMMKTENMVYGKFHFTGLILIRRRDPVAYDCAQTCVRARVHALSF